MGFDIGGPLFVRGAGGFNDVGIKVIAGVRDQALFKVVADFAFAFHPKIGLGPARIAAIVWLGRAFDDHDLGALVDRGDRSREASDAAADDDEVEVHFAGAVVCLGHHAYQVKLRLSKLDHARAGLWFRFGAGLRCEAGKTKAQ